VGVFITFEGYTGSGTISTIPGDTLCILSGCKLPLVLRRDSDGTFKIIEAVYTDGVYTDGVYTDSTMGGEFLSDGAAYTTTHFTLT
jgi:hypothetical protein